MAIAVGAVRPAHDACKPDGATDGETAMLPRVDGRDRCARSSACGCGSPAARRALRRFESLTRRGFLAGAGLAALAGSAPRAAFAQAPSPPPKLLLRQVRVFDGRSDALQTAQVLVQGQRIASVDATNAPPPDDAAVIDCGGRVLMPGLIDAHWHALYAAVPMQALMEGDPGFVIAASTAEAERTLMRGFTTVRDLGGPVFAFKRAIDMGVVPGPRIFPSGAMITTSGGHGDLRLPFEIPRDAGRLSLSELQGNAAIVDNAGDLKLRVREQLLQGASQVKLVGGGGVSSPRSPLDMVTFSVDEIRAAVDVARDWNTYVTVHAFSPTAIQRAVGGGAACVEHAFLIDDETAAYMAKQETWLSAQPLLSKDDVAEQTGPGAERIEQVFAGTPKVYELARKHGIKTAWGSDILFTPELTPRQGVLLTHLGNWFSNAETLRMATSDNAGLLALSDRRDPYGGKLGVVEEGALADLLVVNGNPLDDLALLEKPDSSLALVMKDGRIFKSTLGSVG